MSRVSGILRGVTRESYHPLLLVILVATLGCGNRSRGPVAHRGGERPAVGTAEAGRSISSDDGHCDDADIRRIRATVRTDQEWSALRCLSGRQPVIRSRPGRPGG